MSETKIEEAAKTERTQVSVGEPLWLTTYDRKGETSTAIFASEEAAVKDVCWYVLDFIQNGRLNDDEVWGEFVELCKKGELEAAYALWDEQMSDDNTHSIYLTISEGCLSVPCTSSSLEEKVKDTLASLEGETPDPVADTIIPEAAPTTEVDVEPEGLRRAVQGGPGGRAGLQGGDGRVHHPGRCSRLRRSSFQRHSHPPALDP